MSQTTSIDNVIQSIKKTYVPDTRVAVFEIQAAMCADTLSLTGKTTSKAAYEALSENLSKEFLHLKNHIILLPDSMLGDKTWGVVNNSVGNVQFEGKHSAEMVSQVLLGMPVKILEQKGGWRCIQLPEGYIGWMSSALQPMTKNELHAYLHHPKIIVTSMFAFSYEKPDIASQTVSDLVAGDMLEIKEAKGHFYHAVYPDGREAFVAKSDAKKIEDWLKNIQLTGESIVKTAKRFMGIPYFWGGTSPKGIDCSGFTKSVYFLHGVILARDASQQVKYGKLIDETGNFDNLQLGDLVFFGKKADDDNPHEKVVHVGIALGNKRFIHASDYLRISSFDPDDVCYDAYNTNRYLRAKRVIGEVNTEGIEAIFDNKFYK